jgi:Ser/Thr protein kinase RdoA (MazF antagonist)
MTIAHGSLSDRSLPGLHTALNADALIAALSGHLPECRAGMQILEARVNDVQYTPGSTAHALWKLRVHDSASRRTGRQLVCIKALRLDEPPPPAPEDLIRRYAERRSRHGLERNTPLRTPWLYLPDLHLVMLAFPLDPLLPTLIDVTDPHIMRAALHRAWQPRRARVRTVQADVLSYTPEARAALTLHVLAEDKNTAMPESRRLVGKLHVSRTPERLFAGHWAVWRGAGGRGVAPPAGYVSQAQLSLQEFVDGTRLSDLAGEGSFIGLVRRSAHAIARVHSLTLPVLATRRVDKEMAVVQRWIGILSQLRPRHAQRLEKLGVQLRRELADRMCIRGTIHADFHLANVLTDGTGVTVIDWDQAAHGDPMVDVGRVLASLRVSSLRVHGRLDGFAEVEAGFLEAYLTRTGDDEQRARLFEAVSLLIAAAGPFRLQREGWEEGAELMLDEVDRVVALSLQGPRVTGTAPDPKRQVGFGDRAAWALDRTYAQSLIVPLIHERHGRDIEVTECVPSLCHSSPSELHVRWVIKGYRGAERWRGDMEGIGYRDHSGRGPLRRLELVGEVLTESHPETLQLPRPIGHLEPLSLLIFEPAAGAELVDRIGTTAERHAVERLARALARFHALEIDMGTSYDTARTINSVVRRVERLRHAAHPSAAGASALLHQLQSRIAGIVPCIGPVTEGLSIGAIRMSDAGVGAAIVADVVNGEPLLVVGDLLAQLQLLALHRRRSPAAVMQFARAYADASGRAPADIAAYAALQLLRRGCRNVLDDHGNARAPRAIHAASALLEITA